ncbi:hypothetical protein [Mesorhizobium sp.]|uniref:hypothetical protein n=1 Tax=Mesorhizobium sp. TaxID=1871066 RepID=UPI00121D7E43|nr:hypothetical protein [Mesorhizobium sp.]TIL34328.1 MAG: hypothetical protein E5Y85_11345 [Mesorhizobium sp.]
MMLGVLAARPPSSGTGPGTTLATLDFMNEVYVVNGVTLTAADVIDKPERVGAGGLEILDNDVGGVVSAIGDLLTEFLLVDWTIVIEWEEVANVDGSYLLWMQETVDFHSISIIRANAFQSNPMQAGDSSTISRNVDNTGPFTTGVHKVAVTRTNDRISISTDGSAVDSNTTPNTTLNVLTTASFGGDPTDQSYNGCFIRTVTLTAPVDDSLLPGLSA